jgi:predicted acylesterase/phospholipase RssA
MTSTTEREAVVLSGGGATGAYGVGVLKALMLGESRALNYQPIRPAAFSATSVGAYNAAVLLAHPSPVSEQAILDLEQIWLQMIADQSHSGTHNGVYRLRANPADLLDLSAFVADPTALICNLAQDALFFIREFIARFLEFVVSSAPIERRLAQFVDLAIAFDRSPTLSLFRSTVSFDRLRRSPIPLRIATTRWRDGHLEVFAENQLDDFWGPRVLMASSAIPGIFAPVALGNELFADGGVVMNTPLKPAIDAGATTLHVINLSPDPAAIPVRILSNTLEIIARMFTISFAATINRDLEVARHINRGLKARRLNASNAATRTDRTFAEGVDTTRSGRPYRQLTIHIYKPRTAFANSMALLDFDRDGIADMINRGFMDVADHDCADSECVLPN